MSPLAVISPLETSPVIHSDTTNDLARKQNSYRQQTHKQVENKTSIQTDGQKVPHQCTSESSREVAIVLLAEISNNITRTARCPSQVVASYVYVYYMSQIWSAAGLAIPARIVPL